MKPGIYPELSNEDYHGGPGVSSTTLKKMQKSAAHCLAHMRKQSSKSPSKALMLGQAVHEAVLEPHLFAEHYYTPPDADQYPDALKTLADYKAKAAELEIQKVSAANKDKLKAAIKEVAPETLFWDDINQADPDRELLTQTDWAICTGIQQAIDARPFAKKALTGGAAETSLFWEDPDTGELCKARYDYYREDLGIIFDLKTCEDATERAAVRAVLKYQYHVSAAMYLEAAKHNGLPSGGFAWLFAEKYPPYEIGLYTASAEMLEEGYRLYRQYLNTYAECRRSGVWPGYAGTFREINLPY